MKIKNLLSCLVVCTVATISGCASMPQQGSIAKSNEDVAKPISKEWSQSIRAIDYVDTNLSLEVERPYVVPDYIRNLTVKTNMSKSGNVGDLVMLLEHLGIFSFVDSDTLHQKTLFLPPFEGSLGQYFDAVSSTSDISFSWKKGNVLVISDSTDYIVHINQNESIATKLEKAITSMGGTHTNIMLGLGELSYKATEENHQRILRFLSRARENLAMVTIQASVVTVSLEDALNEGFDWSTLSASVGANETYSALSASEDSESGGVSSDFYSTLGSNLADIKSLATLSSTTAGLNLIKGDINFSAAINFLSTYGETKTQQSMLMKTFSGEAVGLKSTNKVPYIDNVGVQGSQNGYTNGSGFGSSNVKTLDIGLNLELTPYFNYQNSLVSIDISLTLSSLLGFMDLQAGNQLGTISYPNTQEQEFNNIARMRAGESVIIGGITYSQVEDKRNNPSFLSSYSTASKNLKTTRNAMFIILRPTVVIFKDFSDDFKKEMGVM